MASLVWLKMTKKLLNKISPHCVRRNDNGKTFVKMTAFLCHPERSEGSPLGFQDIPCLWLRMTVLPCYNSSLNLSWYGN